MIKVTALDHLVLTVADPARTAEFYENLLGMELRSFGENRQALHFGQQKINLHRAGHEFEPKARVPLPGSADLCFLVEGTARDSAARLAEAGIAVEDGPVPRTGATGPVMSLYLRDPDGNLVELAHRS
ncbi:VOC family protein [Paracoccus methylarcula]|uniref:VOC family protein n=1 Tax=Paracoccus methylarcula TaxID=72022 RepID=A0A422QZS8_9RHOB|nr:VOC family protein [Paracoccus methylarcula]RNF35413.1 VOC family protein [Paracoccus methylarcula]